MRRATAAALAVLAFAFACAHVEARAAAAASSKPAPTHVVDGRVDDWTAPSPLVAGATAIVDGELVHQDHIFDDTGASGNPLARQHSSTPTSTSTGRFRYPLDPGRYADNAADLFQLRLAVADDRVHVLAWLDALLQPDTTVVSLAFDVDGGGERRAWPHAAGVVAGGVDVVVTMWGAGGTVTDLRTGTTSPLDDVAVSTEDNAIEAAFSAASLDGAGVIRVWATTGLWDAGSGGYRAVPVVPPTATEPGNGNPLTASRVWNAAFRTVEQGAFQDGRQAAALTAGDVTPFAHEFTLGELRSGADRPWLPTPGRFYVALVDTGVTIPPRGEGVSYDGVPGRFDGLGGQLLNQQFSFLGRYQPYGLYLPSSFDGRSPLPAALVLHGLGGSHSNYNQFPGFLDDFGEHPPTILVTPLARGSSFYADYGEHEVLRVLDDVEQRWSIDPERLYLTGYSMGGYGVYRLGSLYPDRFAGAVAWAGYTGEFTGLAQGDAGAGLVSGDRDTTPTGDAVRNLESFLHLPVLHLTGTNDQIVPVTGQLAASRRLDELGYRHRLDVYPGYEHLSFGILDEWSEPRAWLGNARREAAPRDVTLAVSEAWRSADLQPVLQLPGASAWWITAATQRDGRDDPFTNGVVRATSEALPGRGHEVVPTVDLSITPTPHTRTGIGWREGPDLATANRLALDLRNIGAVTVDVAAAGLTDDGLVVDVVTDGAARVTLTGPARPAAAVTVAASPTGATAAPDAGGIVLDIPAAGTWRFESTAVSPATAPSPRTSPEPDTGGANPIALPATGHGAAGVAGVAAAVLLLAVATRSAGRQWRP